MLDVPNGDIKRQKRPPFVYGEDREIFNEQVAQGKILHMRNQNLADLDLRGYNLSNMDLSGSYMSGANLSGLDLRGADFSGVSLKNAKVSGCYFPKDLAAEELRLSLEFGTRIRHR
ncbi:MAG: pentapeptide repeat-containing protein [Deltaproteobacteria bacterium]|jgi:uncharacterized protein YjbI with pentapeptide repeats|nr:pentapeptide repeat-containing protein [Deltaproteobacteria bacterium]